MKGLMIQGTTSDAGKSIITAGLCRIMSRRGISVAPFKPQNMALNSAVTPSGGEIGRAQALQASACGLEPHVDFNPVLLKPSSDCQSQVIIQGNVVNELDAKKFGSIKELAFPAVIESYQRLKDQYELIFIEGAGSPAEINLRKHDIANMGFAEAVDCPVILVGDINLGGVFAHLTGTLNLLSQSEQNRVKGFVINKFRGDIRLLQDGLDWLEQTTGKPVLGVLPYIANLKLDAEDAITQAISNPSARIKVKVPVLKRISNHTDFDPLLWHKDVDFEFVGDGGSLAGADLIILPGSKNVRDDLAYLLEQQWDQQIKQHLRYGGKVLGICGGFQMLGNRISDPLGVESSPGESVGLCLLDIETELANNKQLKQVKGTFCLDITNQKIPHLDSTTYSISGYEIHCGVSKVQNTKGSALNRPFAEVVDQYQHTYTDGAQSDDGRIIGTYIHGLLEDKQSLQGLLRWVSGKKLKTSNWSEIRHAELDRLADEMESALDIDKLMTMIETSSLHSQKQAST